MQLFGHLWQPQVESSEGGATGITGTVAVPPDIEALVTSLNLLHVVIPRMFFYILYDTNSDFLLNTAFVCSVRFSTCMFWCINLDMGGNLGLNFMTKGY